MAYVIHGGNAFADKATKRANEMIKMRKAARPELKELLDRVAGRMVKAGAAKLEAGALLITDPEDGKRCAAQAQRWREGGEGCSRYGTQLIHDP